MPTQPIGLHHKIPENTAGAPNSLLFSLEMSLTRGSSIQSASLPPSSSVESIAAFLQTLPVGDVFVYQCKLHNLQDEWINCKSLKFEDHFLTYTESDDTLPSKVLFDDEEKSILSSNLWEIGWFRLIPTAVEASSSNLEIKLPSFEFLGGKLNLTLKGVNFDIFLHVKINDITISQRFIVAWDDQLGIFFFGAEAIGKCPSEHLGIVFNFSKNGTELVPLAKLQMAPEGSGRDVDIERCSALVKEYLRSGVHPHNNTSDSSSID